MNTYKCIILTDRGIKEAEFETSASSAKKATQNAFYRLARKFYGDKPPGWAIQRIKSEYDCICTLVEPEKEPEPPPKRVQLGLFDNIMRDYI